MGREHIWIIDPIDGTRSFLSGHPLFGFLLGLLVKGATLNGKPVSVSKTTRLDQAIFFVNEGDKIYRDHPALFDLLMKVGQTRRFAYDCYPHALLAMGHVDAVIDYDLQPYDFLPVAAVVEAAGGVITYWDGRALSVTSDGRVISAATAELHDELLAMTRHR